MSTSLSYIPVFLEVLNRAASLHIPFHSLSDAKIIADETADFFSMLADVSPAERHELFLSDVEQAIIAFSDFFHVSAPASLSSGLALLFFFLKDPQTRSCFLPLTGIRSELFQSILKNVNSSHKLPKVLALLCSSLLLISSPSSDSTLSTFRSCLSVISSVLTSLRRVNTQITDQVIQVFADTELQGEEFFGLTDALYMEGILRALACFCRNSIFRNEVGILMTSQLSDLLPFHSGNSQVVYCILLNLWLITFEKRHFDLFVGSRLISNIVYIFKQLGRDYKESIVRMCAGIFVNILNIEQEIASQSKQMTGSICLFDAGVLDLFKSVIGRKWKDPDIPSEMMEVCSLLEENIESLSSWDVYLAELNILNFKWSPPHSSANFWSQNIHFFEKEGYLLLRILLAYLQGYGDFLLNGYVSGVQYESQGETIIKNVDSFDKISVLVAINDLSWFLEIHSAGKLILNKLRGKKIISNLLMDSDREISSAALFLLHKLLITGGFKIK
ncbi:hypothetical protein GEMRC1_013110 [Eukaryota sp. GEM-RC1]